MQESPFSRAQHAMALLAICKNPSMTTWAASIIGADPFIIKGCVPCRVPLVDAQQYVKALRAREGAPEARIWVFPEDTHSLDKPQTDYEQWLNVAWWLKQHMG